MSSLSYGSAGTSFGRPARGRLCGVPKLCWCGEAIVELTAKTKQNPCRRFYRCDYAAAHKLADDNHAFKWIDEALLDEIKLVDLKAKRLDEEIKDLKTRRLEEEVEELKKSINEMESNVFAKLEMELQEIVKDKTELALANGKASSIFFGVVIGCFMSFVCSKFVG